MSRSRRSEEGEVPWQAHQVPRVRVVLNVSEVQRGGWGDWSSGNEGRRRGSCSLVGRLWPDRKGIAGLG